MSRKSQVRSREDAEKVLRAAIDRRGLAAVKADVQKALANANATAGAPTRKRKGEASPCRPGRSPD